MTHSRNLKCYPRSKEQDSNIKMEVVISSRSVLRTMTYTLASKFIRMIGLSTATRDADDTILQKRFPNYDPKRDKYVLPNRGKKVKVHKIK